MIPLESVIANSFQGLAVDVSSVTSIEWAVRNSNGTEVLFSTSVPPAYLVDDDGWVLQIWHTEPLRMNNASSVSPGPWSEMLIRVASLVQDAVMDQLGRGWPELYDGHVFSGLLEPSVDDDGGLWWSLSTSRIVPVGQLDLLQIK